jgi:uncharacterized protein
MIGLLVQLALSWLIVWAYDRKDLRVLGLWPTATRLRDLAGFFLLTSGLCASGFLMRRVFGGQDWEVNPNLTPSIVFEGLWWHLRSVLFEELIFRGVLLYILIQKLGAIKAILISAAAFGIYHWFSFGILGNIQQMILVFFITGLMGIVYAYGYVKTFSLYLPIGIHLGWNFTQSFVFPGGPIGTGILQARGDTNFRTESIPVALLVFIVPAASAILFNFLLIRKKKQKELYTT